jgi:hypothetical protein
MNISKRIYILKRWFHYYFNRPVYDAQFGDFIWLYETNNHITEEIKHVFTQQIASSCKWYKYEVLNPVTLIHIKPNVSATDPLAQKGSIAWKVQMRVHNRKSWRLYMESLMLKQIKFKKPITN